MNKEELKRKIFTPQKTIILASGVIFLFVNGLFSLLFMGIWMFLCMPDIIRFNVQKGRVEKKPYTPPKEGTV
jgi:hypothetical protein